LNRTWRSKSGSSLISFSDAINDLREVKAVAYDARKVADILRIGRYDFHVRNTVTETETLREHMEKKLKKEEEKMSYTSTVEIPVKNKPSDKPK
jgi:hypothetical protein